MEAALKALSDPGRRRILTLVRDQERSAGEIAAEFTVTWPAISQHLRVLKEAGLVTERRAGAKRLYRARPEGLTEVRAFLDDFWDDKLERLKREVERGCVGEGDLDRRGAGQGLPLPGRPRAARDLDRRGIVERAEA